MKSIDFVARLVTQEGQVVHGEFKTLLDPEKAQRSAEEVFPGCRILAVYPKDKGLRLEWAQKYWLKR